MTEEKAILVINAVINKENVSELQGYLATVGSIFGKNGGEPIVKYKAINQLAGEQGPEMVAIMRFPNTETIKAIINGENFKNLAELRAKVFSKLNMTICSEM
jgi:uncharacterized protein (DUF1330 family)